MSTILIVDDLLADRRIAEGLLGIDESISVQHAVNGKDAMEQIELHIPDLVLTDLQMPEMDGLELVRAIRTDYPLIPTILMTAKGSEDIARQALAVGAASYVPKRHLAIDLLETVQRVIAASAVERTETRLMNRVVETTYKFENDLSLLSSVVAHMRLAVQQRRLCDETDAMRVATGLDEALLNAFYHGNLEISSKLKEEDHDAFYDLTKQRLQEAPYCDRCITVNVKFTSDQATFVISDEGPGFNPKALPDPTDPEFLERPSGRGMLLMRSFMDDISFNDKGNQVTLVKTRRQPVETP